MPEENYKKKLERKMDEFVRLAYLVTRNFPKEELYGITSQIRRAALSVALNYIEGYARRRPAVQLNFFEISYGSLKECKYILSLAKGLAYLSEENYKHSIGLAEEIGAMLWTEITALDRSIK